MTRLHFGALLVVTTVLHLPCLADNSIPFPPLLKTEWPISTAVVLNNGELSGTPESTIACILPTRQMQDDLDGMKKQGCTLHMTAVGQGTVNYAGTCTGRGGDQLVNVALTTQDERSFH